MSDSPSKKANTYLKAENQDLRMIFAKVKELQALNEKVAALLEPHLAQYCQVGNVSGQRLILVVANGSVATELRFKLNDLLRKLKADPHPLVQKIQDIQCKVHPGFQLPEAPTQAHKRRKMQPLTAETAQIIQEMAVSIEDPKLREIMEKIAGRYLLK